MKRFATAAVAAATALSLSTGAAAAQSSDETTRENLGHAANAALNGAADLHKGSSETSSKINEDATIEEKLESSKAHVNFYGSSYENDAKQEYKAGTTADILWGVGIGVAVIGALLAGAQQAGIAIPGLPR